MKKTMAFLLIAVILFSVSLTVSADMGYPMANEFSTYRVVNPNGIKVKYNGKNYFFPYGARVTAYDFGSRLGFALIKVGNGEYDSGEAASSDIAKVSKDPDENTLLKVSMTLVTVSDDVQLLNGPGNNFGASGTIPAGTELNVSFHDGMYAKVSLNGTEGWVYFRRTSLTDSAPACMIKVDEKHAERIACTKDLILTYAPFTYVPCGVTVVAGADVTLKGYYEDQLGERSYMIASKAGEGWHDDAGDMALVFLYDGYVMSSELDIKLYDYVGSTNVIAKIPAGESARLFAYGYDSAGKTRYCVEQGGVTGWTAADVVFTENPVWEAEQNGQLLPSSIPSEFLSAGSGMKGSFTAALAVGFVIAASAGVSLIFFKRRKKSEAVSEIAETADTADNTDIDNE